MAISKKNARKITVGRNNYHWSVSEDSGYSVLVVQAATGAGQKLEVTVNWSRPEQNDRVDSPGPVPITPALVANVIETAVDQGWEPDATNPKPFSCKLQ